VVEESFDGITVVGLSFNGIMKVLGVLLDGVTDACMTFNRMTVTVASFNRMASFLSVLVCRRLDAVGLRLAGAC